MKNYQLTEDDYLQLYPLCHPARVLREFGKERCTTARKIYSIYSKYGLPSCAVAKKEYLTDKLKDVPDGMKRSVLAYELTNMEKILQFNKYSIQEKIRRAECQSQ